MDSIVRVACILGLSWGLIVQLGCGSAQPPAPAKHDHAHDHAKHDHEETLAGEVKHLQELNAKLRDAFAKKDLKTADELVHEVGEVLDEVHEFAEKEKLAGAALLNVKGLASTLQGHFKELDKQFHGEKGASYEELAKKIDEAVTKLAEAVKK